MTKTVLITGATSGFGRATARRFAAGGWNIIATGRREERLQALAAELGDGRVHPVAFDIRDGDAMDAALQALPQQWKQVDLLVNNAGLALGTAPAQNADLGQWLQMIDTNITALARMTYRMLPGLIEHRGAIINISSIAARYPYTGGNVYGASKAFVSQLSLGLRADLAGTGVRVTTVEPGLAETEFTLVRTSGNQQASDDLYRGAYPITDEDIAQTLWWIANLPAHLNVNRIELMPVSQSFAGLQIARDPPAAG